MADLFLGEFEVGGEVYEVLEEDYFNLPDDIDADLIIRAVKQAAVARASYEAKRSRPTKLRGSKLSSLDEESDIDRFTDTAIIFDGNNLAHKCRHTFNLSYQGQDTSVVYGVLKVIQATVRTYPNVSLIAVCWDYGVPSYRKEASEEYKSKRSHDGDDTYEDFIRQLTILDKALPDMGVLSLRLPNCEADDLMAALASLTSGDCLNVLISSDADLLQCVNYHTVVNADSKKPNITLDNFEARVGVAKSNYLTFKAMKGDSSDNLSGIAGVGESTAKKLIDAYGSPSNIINAANGLNPEAAKMSDKLAEKVRAFGLDGFKRAYTTIRLDYDLVGARGYITRQFKLWKPYNRLKTVGFLKRWLFTSLLDPQFYDIFKELKPPDTLRGQHDIRLPLTLNSKRQPIDLDNGTT